MNIAMNHHTDQPGTRHARRGLALVEVILSTLIIGGLLASVMTVIGVSAQRGVLTDEKTKAAWLAHDLAAEIACYPCRYRLSSEPITDRNVVSTVLGRAASLDPGAFTQGSTRTSFNDIFDFDNWSSTPPVDPDGTPIPGYTGWTRQVDVDAVDPDTLNTRAFNDSAARIVVTVKHRNRVVHTETIIRTKATDALRGADTGIDWQSIVDQFSQSWGQ
ncbi:MAG TPA: type II secretion system protein [Phycisphaerales bacterium]|nr:type II secretion system protein [Phycisphaerales bacterium]